jgi:hypothetical protein
MLIRAFFLLFLLPSVSFAAEPEDCSSLLVENAEGASIVISAAGEKAELEIEQTIAKGESVATGKEAWVDLRLCDGSGLRVGERSKITFEEALARNETSLVAWAFGLLKGSLLATVLGEEKPGQVKMRVRTPTAALGVRGTEFLVDAEDGGDTVVHTMEGEVLMGKREDYDALVKPGFADFQDRFEAVRGEKFSRVGRGDVRPAKAREFRPQELREKRREHFQRILERRKPEAVRERMRKARERMQLKRKEGGLPGEKRQRVIETVKERRSLRPNAGGAEPGQKRKAVREQLKQRRQGGPRGPERQGGKRNNR